MKTSYEKKLEELAWKVLAESEKGNDPYELAHHTLQEAKHIKNMETLHKVNKLLAIALRKFGHTIEAKRLFKSANYFSKRYSMY